MKKLKLLPFAGVAMAMLASNANALSWEGENYTGSFTSTIGATVAIRTQTPGCNQVVTGATGNDAPTGCLAPGAAQDQADLNYKKGKPFSEALRGTHELLLKNPDNDLTLMARYSWLSDFATNTSGIQSGDPTQNGPGMPGAAKSAMHFHGILQDAWVAKGFDLNGEKARVKVGNQVMNWGESLFFGGGINGVNPIDYQRASTPGTLVKETLLAQPAINFSTAIGGGASVEAYYQFGYTPSYFSPVGSYWSTGYSLGAGAYNYQPVTPGYVPTAGYQPLNNNQPGQWAQGQFGGALRWQPESTRINLAAYAINYIDKTPQLSIGLPYASDYNFATSTNWNYAKNRQLFGVSMNAPVGDWTIASELSFRPKDAISLNSGASYCGAFSSDPNAPYPTSGSMTSCSVDSQKYQAAVNAAYTLTPSNSGGILSFFGASGGNAFVEYTGVMYPQMQKQYPGGPVSAGGLYNGMQYTANPADASPLGTKYSSGVGIDLSVNYDNKIIEGWLVTPEIYYQQSLAGYTPNLNTQFLQGNASASAIISFSRNTGGWAAQLNYTQFMGPNTYTNLFRDRSFFAVSGSYTF